MQPWHFVVVTDPEKRREVAEIYQRSWTRYRAALLPSLPPFPSEEAEASFMRGVRASEHLAEHLADTPLVVFCMAVFENTLVDEQGPLDIGTLHASVLPAVQNFMLAARGIGLGTTLTTVFRVHLDELKEVLGLGDRHDVVALVPIGRPLGRFGVAPRRPAEAVTSWDTYGERRAFS